jgi:TIR domain
MSGHAFISYSRGDQEYVTRLAGALRGQGAEVWLDKELDYGSRWARVIAERIRTCAVLIVVMTPAAEASDWVFKEITEAERHDKPIYPLLLDGEDWFILNTYQHEDVRGGALPTSRYLEAVAALTVGDPAPALSSGLGQTFDLNVDPIAPRAAIRGLQRIFVAGSDTAGQLDPFASQLGTALASLDVGVVSLSGPGGIAVGYAMGDELGRRGDYDPNRIQFVYREKEDRPSPGLAKRLGLVIHSGISDKDELRHDLISDCVAVVGIAGGPQSYRELTIGGEAGRPVIPLAATGGAAAAAWNEIRSTTSSFPRSPIYSEYYFGELDDDDRCVQAATRLIELALGSKDDDVGPH